jgi:hypothetical protein
MDRRVVLGSRPAKGPDEKRPFSSGSGSRSNESAMGKMTNNDPFR